MKKILLIDDDQEIGELVKTILHGRYHVEVKLDNDNVPQKIKSFEPDLIMLDNCVGQAMATEIINDVTHHLGANIVPVVLFSAHDDIERIAKVINADSYIAKPFHLQDFYNHIEKLLK